MGWSIFLVVTKPSARSSVWTSWLNRSDVVVHDA